MKSGGEHLSTSCYLNPGLLYTMHAECRETRRERRICEKPNKIAAQQIEKVFVSILQCAVHLYCRCGCTTEVSATFIGAQQYVP